MKSSSNHRSHPIYGDYWGYQRGRLWIPYYSVKYALEYANTYAPFYRIFSNDCTNFVSQTLVDGGWQNETGWYRSSHAWWYNPYNQSWTWAGANNLKDYLFYQIDRDNVESRNLYKLRPGDVLALATSSSPHRAYHMMVVTSVKNRRLYLSGHTNARRNEYIWDIFHGTIWYWGFHIKNGNLN